MRPRNVQIQVLRGVFCILLVMYHYTCRYGQIYNHPEFYSGVLYYLGALSLNAFLFISGYFFINPNKRREASEIIIAKVKRLYPDYIIAITIIFIVTRTGYLGIDRTVSFIDYLLNIPMINVFIGVPYVDGAHWYITFLLGMTILSVILVKTKLIKKRWIWIINSCLILCFYIAMHFSGISILTSMKNYVRYYLFFSLGMELRIIGYEHKKDRLLMLLIVLMNALSIYLDGGFFMLSIFFALCLILGFTIKGTFKFLEKLKPFIVIGDASYLVYLLHQNIGYTIINFLQSIGLNTKALLVVIPFVIVVVFSVLLFMVEEKLRNKIHG